MYKREDPRTFTIPCTIAYCILQNPCGLSVSINLIPLSINKNLYFSINLMPLSINKKLCLRAPKPIEMCLLVN